MIGCLSTKALAFLAVFVYTTHATQSTAFEWKPGFRRTVFTLFSCERCDAGTFISVLCNVLNTLSSIFTRSRRTMQLCTSYTVTPKYNHCYQAAILHVIVHEYEFYELKHFFLWIFKDLWSVNFIIYLFIYILICYYFEVLYYVLLRIEINIFFMQGDNWRSKNVVNSRLIYTWFPFCHCSVA